MNELTVSDIEFKIHERMELLERNGERERLAELGLLMGWILCGEEY